MHRFLQKAGKMHRHHVTNTEYCEINHVEPDAMPARCCLGFWRKDLEPCAEAVHQYCDRSAYSVRQPLRTMRVAAALMEKGVPFTRIIEMRLQENIRTEEPGAGRMTSIMLLDKQCIRHRAEDHGLWLTSRRYGRHCQPVKIRSVHVAIFL